MEHLILNATDHIIYVYKKKLSVKNILSSISRSSDFNLTVCYYHVTYEFPRESTLYKFA